MATQALGIYWERVEYSLAYLSFASFNALYNPVRLMVPKIRYMICGTLGFHGTPVEESDLDYISPHTRKSILTSTNPTIHLLDLYRNAF